MIKRRTLLTGGLALPFLGLVGCSRSSNEPNPYMNANYGPVDVESTVTDLKVTGSIPRELIGRFLRNGPNPTGEIDTGSYHWFTGRGMVHGLRLNDGRAEWYRNRYVGGSQANTNVIGHGGRTLAIVESGGMPVDMSYTLDSIGENASIGTGYTAHPKLDPDTGELHAMCYDWANLRDHIRYVVVDAQGEWSDETEIPMPGMTMIHDMSLTANYAVIYDLPVTLSFVALGTGASFPFRWDDDHEPRVGLLPRNGAASDIIWSPLKPNYAYHPMNAYEDVQGNVVIDIVRYERMFDQDIRGPFGDSKPRLDRWTINPGTRTVSEQIVDARPQEFPRCHPDLNGKPYRYGYSVAVEGYSFPSIYKQDLQTGHATQFDMGAGRHSAEPVFIPRDTAQAEDDGYLMTYVFDENTNRTDLVILDAKDLARPALAQVHLPVRVPYGFHGNWVPDSTTAPA
ncbi:MAG: carotenoid oxygenase family protein [Proteobacteria bacterium]|nr:carotenoid oxygenase family protein [Pseudomonadota bacterium]